VWTGDFNSRTQELHAAEVVDLLQNDKVADVACCDELNYPEWNADLKKDLFEELPITFPPTYKKQEGRTVPRMSSPNWCEDQYITQFRVQWYKGGAVKERVPSYTDRVIKRSVPSLRSCMSFVPESYRAAAPDSDSIMFSSDHDAVGCGLEVYPLAPNFAVPPLMFFESDARIGRVTDNIPLFKRTHP